MSDEKLAEKTTDNRQPEPLRRDAKPARVERDERQDDDSWLYECSVTAD